jgi:peptidoglycan/xylan/chitin deacetylase (PgdA/CDA1 family)
MKSTIIRTGFDTLYFSGAHVLLRPFFEGVGAILMLHHVRPRRGGEFRPNQGLEVTPEFLLQTIEWLRSKAIDIVSLDEMHRRLTERDFGRRFACITFDDGYRDNREWAYPILKAHQAPFAIYIPTSFPDRRGKLWWLALEKVIADNDSIVVTLDGRESRHDCADVAQKREVYETIYWWLRGLAVEGDLHAFVDALAARYGVDMSPVGDALCMTWDETRELAADPLVTMGAHTVNHVMLGERSDCAHRDRGEPRGHPGGARKAGRPFRLSLWRARSRRQAGVRHRRRARIQDRGDDAPRRAVSPACRAFDGAAAIVPQRRIPAGAISRGADVGHRDSAFQRLSPRQRGIAPGDRSRSIVVDVARTSEATAGAAPGCRFADPGYGGAYYFRREIGW